MDFVNANENTLVVHVWIFVCNNSTYCKRFGMSEQIQYFRKYLLMFTTIKDVIFFWLPTTPSFCYIFIHVIDRKNVFYGKLRISNDGKHAIA